jgi:hypothetical protein
MLYRLSHHARQQMATRGISDQAVDAVMQSPGQVVTEPDGRKCYQSLYRANGSQFLLRLIVAEDAAPAVVVTVYYTSRISKYWVLD